MPRPRIAKERYRMGGGPRDGTAGRGRNKLWRKSNGATHGRCEVLLGDSETGNGICDRCGDAVLLTIELASLRVVADRVGSAAVSVGGVIRIFWVTRRRGSRRSIRTRIGIPLPVVRIVVVRDRERQHVIRRNPVNHDAVGGSCANGATAIHGHII